MLSSAQRGIDAVERLQAVQCDACYGTGWRDSTGPCSKCSGSGRIPVGRVELDARSGPKTLLIAGVLLFGIAVVLVGIFLVVH